MNGRRPQSRFPVAACVAVAVVAAACNPDSATTGPSHILGKDFAANLRLVAGDQQTGPLGAPLAQPIKVKVVDAGGQPVQGATVAFSVRAGGGSINPAANVSDTAGIVSSVWTMGTSLGAAKVVAILTNAFILDSTTFTATATVGPPGLLIKVSGDSQTTSTSTKLPSRITVRLQDNFNNRLSGVKVTWAPAPLSGTVSFVTDTTAADGSATADWTLGALAGTNTMSVSVSTASGPVTGSPMTFTATATATPMSLNAGNNQVAAAGTAVSVLPSVIVKDVSNLPVSGISVTFAVTAGGGTITGASAITNASGIATVGSWTLGATPGPNTLTATNASLPGSPVTFTATGTTTPMLLNTGNNQIAVVGTAVPILPSVIVVREADNSPVSGVSVTFAVTAGGGSITGSNAITNASGIASVGKWTLGTTSGTNRLTATSAALPGSPVTFTATGTPDATRVVTWTAPATTTLPATTALDTLRVRVTDQYLNPVASLAVTWNDSIAGNGSVSPTSTTTDTLGNAKAVWTLGRRAGPQILRSKVAGVTQTRTFTGTATVAFADVLAGNFMACGIAAATNNVYCWGAGADGQLGKGGFTSANVPTAAVSQSGDTASGTPLQARQMAGGRNGYCALSLARLLFCWGRQMGLAVNAQPAAVTLLAGTAGVTPNVVAIGEDFGCLMNLAGSGFCGGNNLKGQLGNGTAVGTAVGTWVATTAPPTLFSAISTGRTHACGLPRYDSATPAASQTAYCWGLNNEGQLGDNTTTDRSVPTAVTLGALRFDSTSISTGASHSCALEATGSANPGYAWCWGGNGFGQLGDATTARKLVPTAVNGSRTYSKLYAGEYHTCAIESSTSTAYCWGRNDYGQLGNGSRSNSTTPVAVASQTFRSLSVGELHTCGVSGAAVLPGSPSQTAGTIWCWGDNSFGQLGQGTTASNTPVLTPTRVLYQP